jgi:hypothetical protein
MHVIVDLFEAHETAWLSNCVFYFDALCVVSTNS